MRYAFTPAVLAAAIWSSASAADTPVPAEITRADGSVQHIEAGEAVTIPKEWTGIWETDGYTKIWVIYSEDGSGL